MAQKTEKKIAKPRNMVVYTLITNGRGAGRHKTAKSYTRKSKHRNKREW